MIPRRHLLFVICGACFKIPLQAAVVVDSLYEVQTDLEGNVDSKDSEFTSDPILSVQLMEFNNNHAGPIRAGAASLTRTDNHAGPGSFSFNAGDLNAASPPANWHEFNSFNGPFGGADANVGIQNTTSTKAKVEASANSTSTIEFLLGIGEVVEANLTLNYTIEITNGNQNEASVSWTLIRPDTSVIGISDNDTRSGGNFAETVNTGEMSTVLNQAGLYTLLLSADIPVQEFNNNQHSASAILNGVYFEVIPIPEVNSSTLLLIALGTGLAKRRR